MRSFDDGRLLAKANLLACGNAQDAESAEALASTVVSSSEGVDAVYFMTEHAQSTCYRFKGWTHEAQRMAELQKLMPQLALETLKERFPPPGLATALGEAGAVVSPLWVGMCRHPCSNPVGELAEAVWSGNVAKQTEWGKRLMEGCVAGVGG